MYWLETPNDLSIVDQNLSIICNVLEATVSKNIYIDWYGRDAYGQHVATIFLFKKSYVFTHVYTIASLSFQFKVRLIGPVAVRWFLHNCMHPQSIVRLVNKTNQKNLLIIASFVSTLVTYMMYIT